MPKSKNEKKVIEKVNNNNNENEDSKVDKRQSYRYLNKQRTLVFCSRGITSRYRHLMQDIRMLLPHSKKDSKLDQKDKLDVINEVCELKNCNNCIFFETRKFKDLYMWMSCTPNGPSVKFNVVNIHTMSELKLTGNCLRGSRPILSFSAEFDNDEEPHLQLLKHMFTKNFGTPNNHPRSKPFFDHVFQFTYLDHRIWFRNFQIVWPEKGTNDEIELTEIGPRFVLEPIKIFSGSFKGSTLYQDPYFISPNKIRSMSIKNKGRKYDVRTFQKKNTQNKKDNISYPLDEIKSVFKD
eukprot:TRINITY_DN1538_c2_g2_i1.p1 TRINITY_DN1538_c2_g2~~TRINITY_DN1538_c2_g2_i1.p1  ORF type:complete len:294 (+),score=66.80 TRINITY_DN1538_c2_g2_i1:70-951(+)